MKKRKRPSSPRKRPSRAQEKRTGQTRRTLLAALGIGSLLPALGASAEETKRLTPDDAEKKFRDYWKAVHEAIDQRDNEKHDKEKRERLELAIEIRRRDLIESIYRSDSTFNRFVVPPCSRVTPTPGK